MELHNVNMKMYLVILNSHDYMWIIQNIRLFILILNMPVSSKAAVLLSAIAVIIASFKRIRVKRRGEGWGINHKIKDKISLQGEKWHGSYDGNVWECKDFTLRQLKTKDDQQSGGYTAIQNSFITAGSKQSCTTEIRLRGNQRERLSRIMCVTLLHLSPRAN